MMNRHRHLAGDRRTLEPEQIDVAQIRMSVGTRAAILGELREADRLMQCWLECDEPSASAINFEIEFQDGFVFRIQYLHQSKLRRRPSLTKLIQVAFRSLTMASSELPKSPELYAVGNCQT